MPLEITFSLSDDDLQRFQAIVDQARTNVPDLAAAKQIGQAARELIAEASAAQPPEYIRERLERLTVVIDMVNDEEWQLSDEERHAVLSALAYLCDPDDLIPDHIPGLGFLDDAIYAEIVLRELRNEISFFEEFCKFREAEEARRLQTGEDIKVDREAWLADKRATLHARMRKRRGAGGGRDRWRVRVV